MKVAVIAPLVTGVDLSAEAFPHLSVREGFACGVPVRLARVSFTGELGFEVNAPSDYARGVFEAIWAEGEKRGAVAYGLDVLLALRAEKGFIIVGQDTDGTVTPDDLGMGRMVAMSKPLTPSSSQVGTDGNDGERSRMLTHSARSLPPSISDSTFGMPDQPPWISPLSSAFTIAEPPR